MVVFVIYNKKLPDTNELRIYIYDSNVHGSTYV